MEGNSAFANDNCPNEEANIDIRIRNKHAYLCIGCNPIIGGYDGWIEDASNGNWLDYAYVETEEADTLLTIKNVKVYREDLKKIRIHIGVSVPTTSVGATPFTAALQPNPAQETSILTVNLQAPSELTIAVSDVSGRVRSLTYAALSGENRIPLTVGDLPNGLYFVQVVDERGSAAVLKMVVGH